VNGGEGEWRRRVDEGVGVEKLCQATDTCDNIHNINTMLQIICGIYV